MKKRTLSHLLTGTLLLAGLLAAPLSKAETVNCTPITKLPAVISTQEVYCLTGNVRDSRGTGNAITINANNVTLDLNS